MRDLKELFDYPGVPCGDSRIAEIEQSLGRQLPDAYRELIKQTGGGLLSDTACVFPGDYAPDSYPDGVVIFPIYGNGDTTNRQSNDLAKQAPHLAKIWELPTEVLLFAESEGGMHECFAINYNLPSFTALSILYIDTNPDGRIVQVADSFEEFIDRLIPDSSTDEADEEIDYLAQTLHMVRTGTFSPTLHQALASSGIPDGENLVRALAERISSSGWFTLDTEDESMLMFDLLFLLTSRVRSMSDVDDFRSGGTEGRHPSFEDMVTQQIEGDDNAFIVNWAPYLVSAWWRKRAEKKLLVDTGEGYALADNYIDELLTKLRSFSN